MAVLLLALVLRDTAAGISMKIPEIWRPDADSMNPNLGLVCGALRASLRYYPVSGKGLTQLDVIRRNQKMVEAFTGGAGYSKKGSTDEVEVQGGLVYRTWVSAMKQDGERVAYIVTGGWGGNPLKYMMEMVVEKKRALGFSDGEERDIEALIKGLGFR